MGYPTKVQLIQRKASEQWYINFPAAIARAMEFSKGEIVEWVIQDRNTLSLKRTEAGRLKKAGRRNKKNGSLAAAHQRVVGRVHGRLPTTSHLGASPPAQSQPVGVPGSAYVDRPALHLWAPVRRLVGGLSPLLQGSMGSRTAFRPGGSRYSGLPAGGVAIRRSLGRYPSEEDRHQDTRGRLSTRSPVSSVSCQLHPRATIHPTLGIATRRRFSGAGPGYPSSI